MDRLSDKNLKLNQTEKNFFQDPNQGNETSRTSAKKWQKSNSRRHGAINLPSLISDTNPNPMFAKPETMEPKQKIIKNVFF